MICEKCQCVCLYDKPHDLHECIGSLQRERGELTSKLDSANAVAEEWRRKWEAFSNAKANLHRAEAEIERLRAELTEQVALKVEIASKLCNTELQNGDFRNFLAMCVDEYGCSYSAQGEYEGCVPTAPGGICAICRARRVLHGLPEKRVDEKQGGNKAPYDKFHSAADCPYVDCKKCPPKSGPEPRRCTCAFVEMSKSVHESYCPFFP